MSLDTRRVEELFHAAQQIENSDERRAWLETACEGDPDLRGRVEALLNAAADASQFLNRPAVELAGAQAPEVTQGFESSPAGSQSSERDLKLLGDELGFLQPTTRADSLGRLGHYEVLEVIGQGGFGIVLRAFDEKLHRVVALKVLAPELAANGAARKRFVREARTAAAVKNEHVVGIYGVEENAQPPYLAMEMIDGKSLQDKIDQQGPFSLTEILRIGLQMAEGLAAAHKQGLVHRDIKPANILLENGVERVKITDFGLARAVDDASVTQSGTVAGTPMYMSPEQAEGLAVDHRSDLFSLGTVLYAMCTGHSAFRGSGTHAVLKRVIEAAPRPIREVNPDLPEWLADIIGKLHAKRPEDRFQTAKEVAEVLGQRLADVQAGRAVAKRAQAARRSWSATSIVLLLLGLFLAVPPTLVVVAVASYFLHHQKSSPQDAAKPGVLALEFNDTRIQFRIDGYGANQTAVSDYQTPLESGEHYLWLKLNDLELRTEKFTVPPGQTRELRVDIQSDEASAIYDGRPLALEHLVKPAGGLRDGRNFEPTKQDRWIDLLSLVDPKGDVVSGPWKLEGGGLVCEIEPDAKLALPVIPTGDYRLIVKFRRVKGEGGGPIICLPVGAQSVQFATYNPPSGACALEAIDGCYVDNPGNPTQRKIEPCRADKLHVVDIRVRLKDDTATIQVDMDGNRVVDFASQPDRFSLHPAWSLGDNRRIGLRAWDTFRFESVQVTMLSGEAKLLRPAKTAQAAPGAAPGDHALEFNGRDSYVTIPSLRYAGDHPLTVEAWVVFQRAADEGAGEVLLGNPENSGFGLSAPAGDTGRRWSFGAALKGQKEYAHAYEKQPLPRNELIHVAGVYDVNSEVRFYINGELQSRTAAVGEHKPSDMAFTLGANPNSGNRFTDHFLGRMHEVRISKIARYDDNFAPDKRFRSDNDTLALYHFDDGTGVELKDSSGNHHHGKIVGATWGKASTEKNGFIPLFNGEDLAGWKSTNTTTTWTWANGVLTARGRGDLLTTERTDFQNFHLRLSVKSDAGAWVRLRDAGGIDGDRYLTGIRPAGGADSHVGGGLSVTRDKQQTGLAKNAVAGPADRWHTLEIIAVGNRLRTFVNGNPVADVTDPDNTRMSGGIALSLLSQSEQEVHFKDVEIKELPPE